MLTLAGTYDNGKIMLENEFKVQKPVKVLITFLEEVAESKEKSLKISDFNFYKSQKILKNVKGNFSDAVIEERYSDENIS